MDKRSVNKGLRKNLMSEIHSLKMRVFITVTLIMCICSEYNGEPNDDENPLSTKPNKTKENVDTPNYTFDQQISGFNSTKVTSGPIILADKRTLFIPDLQLLLHDTDRTVAFWAGIGSPYGSQKQLVHQDSLESPKNLYVVLPDNLTLDEIDFFQIMANNESLDYVIFEKADRKAIRSYDEANMEDTIFRIPKCCWRDQYLNDTLKDCAEAKRQINFEITIFESNETGLDPEVKLNYSEYQIIPYYRDFRCKENGYKVKVEDLHGLIYNSSLIIQGTGILSHRDYCIDILAMDDGTSETVTLYCFYVPTGTSDPDFYLPVLIISAICFALSAAAYGIILKEKEIHKKCFIIFSSSMFVTFVSLIVMQAQSNTIACNLFGFIFIFTSVLSLLWMLILCLELLYLVICPIEEKRYDQRWYWYSGISLGFSVMIFVISLCSGELGIPDVPNSFIMSYGSDRCQFQTTFSRAFFIFVPMIVSIAGSFGSLIALQTYINKNDENKNIKNHVDWLMNRNSYKFLSRTYIMIIIVACFWLLNVVFYAHQIESGKTQLALDVIKASLGLVTFISFVTNKYTRAEIREKCTKKKKDVTEAGLGLNGIPTPETPEEFDPFVRHMNNMTSFENHRFINSG